MHNLSYNIQLFFKLSIKFNFWQNIILFFIIIILIYILTHYKIYYKTLKINYWNITLCLTSFYISFYFGLAIYFRIYHNIPINLEEIKNTLITYYEKWLTLSIADIIYYYFIFIIIICIWIFIFIKFRNLTKIEFYKLHLYLTFYMNKNKNIKFTSYGTFWYALKLSGYTFKDFINYCFFLNMRLYEKTNKKIIFNIITKFIFKIKYIPLLLLIIFIYYDYKYNNGDLYLLYNYMPLYFILTIYIQISNYLAYEKIPLMHIFFERYYCYPHILYVNLTSKEEEVLKNWINHSYFYRENKNEPIYILDDTQLHPIQIFHRFVLKHKNNIRVPIKSSKNYNLFYYNENTNAYFYYKYLQNIDEKYFFKDKNKYTYNYDFWIYYILEKNQPKKK